MKRILLEALGFGAILLLTVSTRSDVGSLRQANSAKEAEIARLSTRLEATDPEVAVRLSSRIENQDSRVDSLGHQLSAVEGRIKELLRPLDERTRSASRRATEAAGTSKALSKAVESTQRVLNERARTFTDRTQRLEAKLTEYDRKISKLRDTIRLDPKGMTHDMLTPTVQLSGEETVGSGTLIASLPARKGKGYETWVLTANHVVRNILADDPALERKGMTVTVYDAHGKSDYKCDAVIRNPAHDLALVKVRSSKRIGTPARLAPPEAIAALALWTPVYAVGCPLGNDPVPTGGFVSSLANVVRGTKYWMINAPTYYGNSGGGIFEGKTHELVAVFSKIYTHGSARPIVIPHMGLAVPMSLVYPWLEKQGYGFLVPGDADYAAPGK